MKITGSKLPLVMACPASAALPQIDNPVGAPAVRGKDAHRFLELVAEIGRDEALLSSPAEMRPFLAGIDVDRLPTHLLPEAAFALDWHRRSARFLGSGLGRDYPPQESPTEIMLTIDLLGVSDTAVIVEDYKTGRTRYGNPERFAQLLAAALAACWVHGKDTAHVGLIYVDKHGEVWPVRGVVDMWDLETFAAELEIAMGAVGEARALTSRGGTPDVTPGDHCEYCPAFRACPDKIALVKHLPEHIGAVEQPGYLAPSRLADTWKRIAQIRDIVNRIEEEVRACSMREPIDLGGGWELGPKEITRESFDGRIARDVIAGMLGPEVADAAVTLEVTKSAIEKEATRYRNDKGGKDADGKRIVLASKSGDGLLDRVYAEIRRREGAKTTTTHAPTVYRRKS